MSNLEGEVLDLEDRDPQNLNRHIEVTWEHLIGEPHSIRSPECAWSLSRYCFKFSKLGTYTCLSVLCAPIAACFVGTIYALFHFQYIWCTVPSLRLCKLSCGVTKSFIKACTQGLLVPIMDALGRILYHIRVRTGPIQERGEDEWKEVEDLLV